MRATLFLAQAQPGGFDPSFFLMMGLVFVVFYLFIIRPQRKREDERKSMISAVGKGDRIKTVGGIHGTVVKVDDTSLLVEVDTNTKLRIDKNAVASAELKDHAAKN